MQERTAKQPGLSLALPVFVLSFRHRDELASAVSRHGWHPIAARRAEGAELRFISSGAKLAIVDGRGAFDEGLAATRALSDTVEANTGAMLVLLSRTDIARLDEVYAGGATHFLASPFGETELRQAIRFAERHADRLAGGETPAISQANLVHDSQLTWELKLAEATVSLSPALAGALALPQLDVPLRKIVNLLPAQDRKAAFGAIRRVVRSGQPTAFVHGMSDNVGARHVEHLRLVGQGGSVRGSVERLQPPQPEQRATGRDQLTGLASAAESRRWLRSALECDADETLTLLLSVDRFEQVNTTFGRATGDSVLQAIGRRLAPLVRDAGAERHLIGRMAGAEFIMALQGDISPDRAAMLASALADACERPFMLGGDTLVFKARIGGVFCEPSDVDETTVLRRASAALAEARASERQPVCLLSKADADRAAHRRELQQDLLQALERDEIDVLFQPQVSIAKGQIIGVEALARWQHPQHGTLGAVTLFSIADDVGFVEPLSRHVQNKAFRLAAAWERAGAALRLSVNVTSSDFARDGFAGRFLADTQTAGFPMARLTVEVTENGLIEDLASAAAILTDLRSAGCRVAIDDFGTGYSSLSYLKSLPLDYLKIDKGMSDDIVGSPRDRVVVRGVIDMARSLGLSVIAEGVESEPQLDLLAEEGCNYYQGFLCSEPLADEHLEAFVTDWNARRTI